MHTLTRPLAFFALFTSTSLAAQTVIQPDLEIVANPSGAQDIWDSAPNQSLETLKIRVSGEAGGWFRIVAGATDYAVEWLRRPLAKELHQFQSENWIPEPASPVRYYPYDTILYQREIDLCAFHPYDQTPAPESAYDWYVPILKSLGLPTGQRDWRSDVPLWSDTTVGIPGFGELNRDEWASMNWGQIEGAPIPDVFGIEYMFKLHVLKRALLDPEVGYEGALEYFNEGAYANAFVNGRIQLDLSAIYVRDADLAYGEGSGTDKGTPRPGGFLKPPKGRGTNRIVITAVIPLPGSNDFDGSMTRPFRIKERVFFIARRVFGNLRIQVPTTRGYVWVDAGSYPTFKKVLQYTFLIPGNPTTGTLYAKTTGNPKFVVGEITAILPEKN